MKLVQYIFISLLFTIGLLACTEKIKMVEIKNEEGQVVEKYGILKDSVMHGPYESMYENGSLFEKSEYKNGKTHGLRTLYYQDGTPEVEEYYQDGVIHGSYKTYYENGQLNVSGNYTDGVLSGIVKKYFETGELMEEVHFENNQENGPFTEYYKNGQAIWKGTYKNGGNEIGALDSFNLEGEVVKKMLCGEFMEQYICQTIWTKEKGDIALKIAYDE